MLRGGFDWWPCHGACQRDQESGLEEMAPLIRYLHDKESPTRSLEPSTIAGIIHPCQIRSDRHRYAQF